MSACKCCEQLDYAAIVADAMRVERERIIKLLEEAEPNGEWADRQMGQSIVQWSKENFIALIKGENK